MATAVDSSPAHSPGPSANTQQPRGILKNSSLHKSPPPQDPPQQRERSMSGKEVTLANTQLNAGRRSSSAGRQGPGSRRQSAHGPDGVGPESSQRLKWDEANLYLTEQERSSTMKITEPKTPYAKHYDPAEDPSDEDDIDAAPLGGSDAVHKTSRKGGEDDIPGLSLGEPEEEVPQEAKTRPARSGSVEKTVHVDQDAVTPSAEEEVVGLTPEEREKHRQFEKARKKHYEMKNVAQLLGNPEAIPDDEDDGEESVPPVPRLPNGSV